MYFFEISYILFNIESKVSLVDFKEKNFTKGVSKSKYYG